jgi:aspartyl-tRNA(Asn)/glutamyl-tRNA(Gln) amidotransferase subunit A
MSTLPLTIKETTEKLKKKEVSVVEITKTYFKRIKEVDGKIHAFLALNEENALKEAQQADDEIKTTPDIFEKKPLLGVTVGVKDLYTTKDLKTTAGSKIIEHYVPPFDATVVKKYKEAGAIIIGKTNEDAWGHGSSGENSDYDPTRNPYDLERVPGGSSSGSGAAVAAEECLVATGTDTGSSVRLPAAFCNLVGLKPTYGRVSRYGVMAMASSFDTIGHMTNTVHDNAQVLEVTAGRDPFDATSSPLVVPQYTKLLNKKIAGMKIGIPKEYFVSGIDSKVAKVTQDAIDTFKKMGATIEEVSLPHTDVAMACYYILVPSEVSSNLARFDGVRYGEAREVFGAEAKRRIMLGAYTLSSGYYDAYYLKAAKVRRLIKQDFEETFKKVDVLIAPSSPSLPFKIGEKADDPLQMYLSDIFLCPINLAGVPSLNVPCGFVGELPVGLQIIGPHFKEELLYQVGSQYEKETEFYKKRPQL